MLHLGQVNTEFSSTGEALAGMSMGSGITANVGLKRLDVFGSIGLSSGGMFRSTEDPRTDGMKQASEELAARKIKIAFKAYPGAHEWKVWRHSLADMAPLLFR